MKILATIFRVIIGACLIIAGTVEGSDMISGGKVIDALTNLGAEEKDNKEEN